MVDKLVGCFVHLLKVLHQNLNTSNLVIGPTVQLVGGMQVGKTQRLVKARHVGLIDTADGELTCANILIIDEIAKNFIANL